MQVSDITKENGFDIDFNNGSALITNKEAVELLNYHNGWDIELYKIQGLIPNHEITIEQQITGHLNEIKETKEWKERTPDIIDFTDKLKQ